MVLGLIMLFIVIVILSAMFTLRSRIDRERREDLRSRGCTCDIDGIIWELNLECPLHREWRI